MTEYRYDKGGSIPPGLFSPIEDVVAEAERRAVAQHKRETEPCQHSITERRMCDRFDHCAECGSELSW